MVDNVTRRTAYGVRDAGDIRHSARPVPRIRSLRVRRLAAPGTAASTDGTRQRGLHQPANAPWEVAKSLPQPWVAKTVGRMSGRRDGFAAGGAALMPADMPAGVQRSSWRKSPVVNQQKKLSWAEIRQALKARTCTKMEGRQQKDQGNRKKPHEKS